MTQTRISFNTTSISWKLAEYKFCNICTFLRQAYDKNYFPPLQMKKTGLEHSNNVSKVRRPLYLGFETNELMLRP
jgi:hypothetical protein